MGSLLLSAMSEGEARALYALILDLECRRLSSSLDSEQSSHPHLKLESVIIHFSFIDFPLMYLGITATCD